MKNLIILTLTIFITTTFAQNADLSEIENLLPKDSIVRMEFVQTKEIKSLDKPLVSTGKILVVRNKGIVWRTETPSIMTKVIPLIENDMSKSEYTMIAPFFNGDFSALEKRFFIDLSKNDSSWTMLITPKSSALKRQLKNISITSTLSNKKQEVIIMSADNNTVRINLTNEIPTQQVLDEDENNLFELSDESSTN